MAMPMGYGQGHRETGCGRGRARRPEAREGAREEENPGLGAEPEAARRTRQHHLVPAAGLQPPWHTSQLALGTGISGSTSLSQGCPWPWESPLSESVALQLSER